MYVGLGQAPRGSLMTMTTATLGDVRRAAAQMVLISGGGCGWTPHDGGRRARRRSAVVGGDARHWFVVGVSLEAQNKIKIK